MAEIKDDAQSWFDSMGQDIQDYEVPESPVLENDASDGTPQGAMPQGTEGDGSRDYDPDRPFGDVPTVTNDDLRNQLNMQAVNRPTATVIVGVMDVVVPILLTLVIKGTDRETARLDDTERETLTDAWAQYLGTKNVQASPGVVLLTTILTIYGAKAFTMIQQQKVEQQAQRIAELEHQLEESEQARFAAEARARKTETK